MKFFVGTPNASIYFTTCSNSFNPSINTSLLISKFFNFSIFSFDDPFISIKLTTATQKKKKKKQDIVVENGEVKEDEIDPMEQMQAMSQNMTYMIPIMSVIIAVIAPLGLALYWLVSNILMIIERLIINKIMSFKESKDGEEEQNG